MYMQPLSRVNNYFQVTPKAVHEKQIRQPLEKKEINQNEYIDTAQLNLKIINLTTVNQNMKIEIQKLNYENQKLRKFQYGFKKLLATTQMLMNENKFYKNQKISALKTDMIIQNKYNKILGQSEQLFYQNAQLFDAKKIYQSNHFKERIPKDKIFSQVDQDQISKISIQEQRLNQEKQTIKSYTFSDLSQIEQSPTQKSQIQRWKEREYFYIQQIRQLKKFNDKLRQQLNEEKRLNETYCAIIKNSQQIKSNQKRETAYFKQTQHQKLTQKQFLNLFFVQIQELKSYLQKSKKILASSEN